MKKILYIVSSLRRCGPTNQLYNLIKYLDRSQFEPYLITLSPEPALKDSKWTDFENLGVRLYPLNLSRFKGFFCAKKKIFLLINEIKPDIIHTQGIRGDIISSELLINIPKINTIRNFPQQDYIMTYGRLLGCLMCLVYIRCLKKMSLCVGVSDAAAENLRQYYHLSNVAAIKNGVDTDCYYPLASGEKKTLREKLGLPAGGRICISSGHLSERKDPLFLIKAWKKNIGKENNYYLVLVGGGKLLEKCRQECGGNKNIHIIGHVNNVKEYLQAGDYFISVSRSEGFPNAVLESMACGLPVILSDIRPHEEMMALAPNAGACYKLGNEDHFNQMLKKIFNMNRDVMSNTALAVIREKFSARIMSRAYQQTYYSLCSSGGLF
jgi:glycosyltransferase involved in cell wall biosynthesis